MDNHNKPALSLSAEPKTRGANRSTKVAGKLKVLPDQPTPPTSTAPGLVPSSARREVSPPPRRVEAVQATSGPGTTEDSDADDDEDDEVGVAEEEVCTRNLLSSLRFRILTARIMTRFIIRLHLYLRVQHVVTR
jgi:hypothetical protein